MRMLRITNVDDLIANSMHILEPSLVDSDGKQREDGNIFSVFADLFSCPQHEIIVLPFVLKVQHCPLFVLTTWITCMNLFAFDSSLSFLLLFISFFHLFYKVTQLLRAVQIKF